MASSRGPLLLYILPLLSVLVLGLSLFLGLEGAAVRSALVFGGPTDSDEPFRGRLRVVEEADGSTIPLAGEPLIIKARQGTHVLERRLVSDSSGWVEFELPLRAAPPFELWVLDRLGRPLVQGKPVLETKRWRRSARLRGGTLGVRERDSLQAIASIERGVLAVPFFGRGTLAITREGKPLAHASLELKGVGAALRGNTGGVTDEEGRFPFDVAPQEHVASLHVTVVYEGEKWGFEQMLPVVPGAYGIRQKEGGFTVLSPVPRDEVWFTFVTETERLSGGRVELKEDAKGAFSGEIPEEAVPQRKGLFLVLASSADGRSPSTVGYPLDGQGHTLDIWDGYLLDGGPAARARAQAHHRRVRWTLGGYAGLSGLLTLLLFISRVRRADHELAERLTGAGASTETRDSSPVPLLIAVLGLFFAFSAGVLWIVAR